MGLSLNDDGTKRYEGRTWANDHKAGGGTKGSEPLYVQNQIQIAGCKCCNVGGEQENLQSQRYEFTEPSQGCKREVRKIGAPGRSQVLGQLVLSTWSIIG